MPSLSVVIPTYNNPDSLRLCLYALSRQTERDFETIVINDGGERGTVEAVVNGIKDEADFSGITLTYSYLEPPKTHFRAAAARNAGIRLARGNRILFLDEDCLASPTLIAGHRAYDDKKIVVVGRRKHIARERVAQLGVANLVDLEVLVTADDQRFKMNTNKIYGAAYDRLRRGEREFQTHYRLCWTFNLSVPAAMIKSLGGFWEEFTEYGGEDQEVCWRLQQAGCSLWLNFNLIAYHLDHEPRKLAGKLHFEMINRSRAAFGLVRNGGPII